MLDILIVILLVILIFKDKVLIKSDAVDKSTVKDKYRKLSDEEERKMKERRKEFNSIMEYSIEDAIQSKKDVR